MVVGPNCSARHIPEYIHHKDLKSAGKVFVVVSCEYHIQALSKANVARANPVHSPTTMRLCKYYKIADLSADVRASVVNINYSMKAWAESLDPGEKSGVSPIESTTNLERYINPYATQIRFLGDPSGQLTKAWDLEFDSAAIFGLNHGKRCAIVTQDGKVKSVSIEPDNTGVNGERRDSFLSIYRG